MCRVWPLVPAALPFCGGYGFRVAGGGGSCACPCGTLVVLPSRPAPPPPSASAPPRYGPDLLRRPLPAQLTVQ